MRYVAVFALNIIGSAPNKPFMNSIPLFLGAAISNSLITRVYSIKSTVSDTRYTVGNSDAEIVIIIECIITNACYTII